MADIIEVDARTVKDWMDNNEAHLIDVREHMELMQFAIPGAIHNPMSNFDFEAVPPGDAEKVVFVCAHGMRSQQVAQYLIQQNQLLEAYNLTGGVAAWAEAGLPAA